MKKISNYQWPIEPEYIVVEHDKYGIRKSSMSYSRKGRILDLILLLKLEQRCIQVQMEK